MVGDVHLSPPLLFEFYSLLPFPAFLGKLYSPHLLVPKVPKMSKLGHPIPLLLKPFLFWCAVLYCWTQMLLLCPLLCSTTQINIKLNSSNCTVSKMQISTSLHILKKLPRFSCLNLLYFSVHSPFFTYPVWSSCCSAEILNSYYTLHYWQQFSYFWWNRNNAWMINWSEWPWTYYSSMQVFMLPKIWWWSRNICIARHTGSLLTHPCKVFCLCLSQSSAGHVSAIISVLSHPTLLAMTKQSLSHYVIL